MKKRVVAVAVLALVGAAGCELIVDFDRSLIDAGAVTDGTFPDSAGQDTSVADSAGQDTSVADSAGQDTSVADTSTLDAGSDTNDSASAADTADE
jgi:hypothetical protein